MHAFGTIAALGLLGQVVADFPPSCAFECETTVFVTITEAACTTIISATTIFDTIEVSATEPVPPVSTDVVEVTTNDSASPTSIPRSIKIPSPTVPITATVFLGRTSHASSSPAANPNTVVSETLAATPASSAVSTLVVVTPTVVEVTPTMVATTASTDETTTMVIVSDTAVTQSVVSVKTALFQIVATDTMLHWESGSDGPVLETIFSTHTMFFPQSATVTDGHAPVVTVTKESSTQSMVTVTTESTVQSFVTVTPVVVAATSEAAAPAVVTITAASSAPAVVTVTSVSSAQAFVTVSSAQAFVTVSMPQASSASVESVVVTTTVCYPLTTLGPDGHPTPTSVDDIVTITIPLATRTTPTVTVVTPTVSHTCTQTDASGTVSQAVITTVVPVTVTVSNTPTATPFGVPSDVVVTLSPPTAVVATVTVSANTESSYGGEAPGTTQPLVHTVTVVASTPATSSVIYPSQTTPSAVTVTVVSGVGQPVPIPTDYDVAPSVSPTSSFVKPGHGTPSSGVEPPDVDSPSVYGSFVSVLSSTTLWTVSTSLPSEGYPATQVPGQGTPSDETGRPESSSVLGVTYVTETDSQPSTVFFTAGMPTSTAFTVTISASASSDTSVSMTASCSSNMTGISGAVETIVSTSTWTDIVVRDGVTQTFFFPHLETIVSTATAAPATSTVMALPSPPTFVKREGLVPRQEESKTSWIHLSTGVPDPAPLSPTEKLCDSDGVVGNFTIDFDDGVPNAPIFSPLHYLWFSEYFVVKLPGQSKYTPSSRGQLAEFVPPSRTSQAPQGMVPQSYIAQIGAGNHMSLPYFHFDWYSMNMGCESTTVPCQFTVAGYRWNPTTGTQDWVLGQDFVVPACMAPQYCPLTPIAGNGFENLTSIFIQTKSNGKPAVWWVDDIMFGWSDNSCEASDGRKAAPVQVLRRESIDTAIRRGIWQWTPFGIKRLASRFARHYV